MNDVAAVSSQRLKAVKAILFIMDRQGIPTLDPQMIAKYLEAFEDHRERCANSQMQFLSDSGADDYFYEQAIARKVYQEVEEAWRQACEIVRLPPESPSIGLSQLREAQVDWSDILREKNGARGLISVAAGVPKLQAA